MEYKINELKDRAYQAACGAGWFKCENSHIHELALVMAEVGVALDVKVREEKLTQREMFERESVTPQMNPHKHWVFCYENFIKDTWEDRLAAVVIRMLALAGKNDATFKEEDFAAAKIEKGVRRAEKELEKSSKPVTIPEEVSLIFQSLVFVLDGLESVADVLQLVLVVAGRHKMDVMWFVEQRLKYMELMGRDNRKEDQE